MSYQEAVEDKIPHGNGRTGRYYYPPCQYCGKRVASWSYIRGVRYTCPSCRAIRKNADKLQKLFEKMDADKNCGT